MGLEEVSDLMKYETLYNMLPVSEEGKMVLGLETMEELMEILDHPENKVPIIHIAGTNGKGSTASILSTTLKEAGYRVGLFTSPSLTQFNERIRINNQAVSDDDLMELAELIKERVNQHAVEFTEFELFTAMACLAFERQGCDIGILEVGLGGRLDATNVVSKPELTIITKIALDHQAILGSTIGEIAGEKTGIIKKDVPLVVYPQEYEEARQVILNKADQMNAPTYRVELSMLSYELTTEDSQSFFYKGKEYTIQLLEEHQIKNAAVAVQALEVLQEKGWKISEEEVQKGLMSTAWPARFEKISEHPAVIIDGSHNVDGLQELQKNISRYFNENRKIAIVGMLKDKDVDDSLPSILPLFEEAITVTPNSQRALTANELEEKIMNYDLIDPAKLHSANSYEQAYEKASELAGKDDVICVFGSTYYVGIIRELILNRVKKREDVYG